MFRALSRIRSLSSDDMISSAHRWMDRTMTVLRTGRLEACEKEFAGLGGGGLFLWVGGPPAGPGRAERAEEAENKKGGGVEGGK